MICFLSSHLLKVMVMMLSCMSHVVFSELNIDLHKNTLHPFVIGVRYAEIRVYGRIMLQ